jgi:hypothetical protein
MIFLKLKVLMVRTATDVHEVMWRPTSKTVGFRSTRNKRDNFDLTYPHLLGKRNQGSSKHSWLMLREHEDSYRYIPQLGDDVMYLRQVILFASVSFLLYLYKMYGYNIDF